MTYRKAAWDFLRGIKMLNKIDDGGGVSLLEHDLTPNANGELPPSVMDEMDVSEFGEAVLKLALHIDNPSEQDMEEYWRIIGDKDLMPRLESLAMELVNGEKKI